MAVSGALAGSEIAVTSSLGLAWGVGGAALGAAVIYYGQSADTFKLGLIIAAASIKQGMQFSREGYRESTNRLKQELDPSPGYRFVRYLPEYMWMGWSDQAIIYPVELYTPSSRITIRQPSVVNRTSVAVSHLPDSGLWPVSGLWQ